MKVSFGDSTEISKRNEILECIYHSIRHIRIHLLLIPSYTAVISSTLVPLMAVEWVGMGCEMNGGSVVVKVST